MQLFAEQLNVERREIVKNKRPKSKLSAEQENVERREVLCGRYNLKHNCLQSSKMYKEERL